MKDHSGLVTYKDNIVEILPYFLYEIDVCKYWKNGYCVLENKLFKSDKYIPIKKSSIYKKYKDYFIEKCIRLLGVTTEFCRDNNLCKKS